jgi:hypothetical protein
MLIYLVYCPLELAGVRSRGGTHRFKLTFCHEYALLVVTEVLQSTSQTLLGQR